MRIGYCWRGKFWESRVENRIAVGMPRLLVEPGERVSQSRTRMFFGTFVLVGLAGVFLVTYRHGFTRPYLFPIPIAISGSSVRGAMSSVPYAARQFQARVSIFLMLLGFQVLMSLLWTN
jgi:hypothetical protein